MSNIANNIAAKLGVAFVAAAMVFTFAAPAQAQTTEELQQMINDLLAQVASLQAQLGGGSSMGGGVCPYTWTRSLNMGASGADVMKLQQFLNSDAETRVAATGVGSAGMETEYYGALTGAAVAKFQAKYRTEILSPLGLVNPTTYFGPSTMAQANKLCATAMADDSADDATDDDADDATDDDDDVVLGGEASLGDTDLKDGDDTDLEEGQENAPVAEFEVEFTNGDARISRIDVELEATGSEEDPWDTFENVSLWVDGDMVAEEDADSEGDYLNDEKTIRLSGLNIVGMEDETVTIVIAVSVQNSIDDLPATWNVDVTGMRYEDADEVVTTETDAGIGVTAIDFDIKEAGGDDELKIQSSSNNPDSTVLAVEENSNSDWHTVLVFDMDTDDSVNDIVVETMTATVTVPGNGEIYSDVVNDARLVIDGEVFDDISSTANPGTATATITFDIDKDLEIDAGDEVEVELQLEFKKQSGNYAEGQRVQASVNEVGWEAEGADDLEVGTQIDGSVTGKEHTLRTEGIIVEPGTHSTDTQGDGDTVGVFKVVFEVTAFENDFYIAENATSTNASTDGGVYFSVDTAVGTPTSVSAVLASTAEEDTDGVFTIEEGETETFTLTVTVDASAAGNHRVLLNDIWFTSNSDGVSSLETDPASPASSYRTDYENILN